MKKRLSRRGIIILCVAVGLFLLLLAWLLWELFRPRYMFYDFESFSQYNHYSVSKEGKTVGYGSLIRVCQPEGIDPEEYLYCYRGIGSPLVVSTDPAMPEPVLHYDMKQLLWQDTVIEDAEVLAALQSIVRNASEPLRGEELLDFFRHSKSSNRVSIVLIPACGLWWEAAEIVMHTDGKVYFGFYLERPDSLDYYAYDITDVFSEYLPPTTETALTSVNQ